MNIRVCYFIGYIIFNQCSFKNTDLIIVKKVNGATCKDVRAHCYCASLQRTQIHTPRHALSARTKRKNEQGSGRMLLLQLCVDLTIYTLSKK